MISPNTEGVAGELAALANAAGGVLFFGIDDTGAMRGIPPEHVDTVEHWIVNVATHHRGPPIRPILRKMLLPRPAGDEQRILLAEVPCGLYAHRISDGVTTCGSVPPDATSRPRSLSGSSSNGAENAFSTSNPSSLHPWAP